MTSDDPRPREVFVRLQITAIRTGWNAVCDEARLADADRRLLWWRQILNGLAFEGLVGRLGDVIEGLGGG